MNRNISGAQNGVYFPYYHHVFDDERGGFEKQLRYLKNYGDFISIDTAIELLNADKETKGKYFCVSFDDGYECCYHNVAPICKDLSIPVVIYLPTSFIGLDPEKQEDLQRIRENLPANKKILSFLNWQQCRDLLRVNFTFGSHTHLHINIASLTKEKIELELDVSKGLIEEKLGVKCEHFACPWGKVEKDFDPNIAIPIAKETGFHSFATTHRGINFGQKDIFMLRRDHLMANWPSSYLNYFFGR